MADKKKEPPKPVLYNPLVDKSIDDAVSSYHSLYKKEAELENQKDLGYVRDSLYNTVVGHLAQHGTDEKTGKLKRHSYGDMKGTDRQKWSEDLVSRLALVGIEKEFGKDAVKVYADPKNRELLREYVQSHMVTEELGSYEGLIEYVGNMNNIKDGFYDDEVFSKVMGAYMGTLSTLNKNRMVHKRHIKSLALSDAKNYKALAKHANGKLKAHKHQLTEIASPDHMLKILEDDAKGSLKPHPRAKHMEPIPEKK